MNKLLLLFLTIPVVFLLETKCPKWFIKFPRTPTAKNNYTKEWCLGIFSHSGAGNRDTARGLCNNYNASLSLPENNKEYIMLSWIIQNLNDSKYHYAVDGEFTPYCKNLFLKKFHFDAKKDKGECNYRNKLFAFDDPNTDPTFAIEKNIDSIPNGYSRNINNNETIAKHDACYYMEMDTYDDKDFEYEDVNNHTRSWGSFRLHDCGGEGLDLNARMFDDEGAVVGALCGTRPI